ncbi:MAG TPA: RNA polymerase-binding protein RbpA [Microbacteriaceae bacterium]|nr:RNA polymerase-binding protein RbpA [Microbacteriaceae bacterium]
MADRSLRGMRLGAQSFQSEEGVDFVDRITASYRSEDGTTFDVVFAVDAEIPPRWENPRTNQSGVLLDAAGNLVEDEQAEERAQRTHWDMLLERRSIPELEELLAERLEIMRAARGQGRKTA